jgi:signal transduction histidine kinase
MKLAAYYNRAGIFATLSVLLVGAIIYFFVIQYLSKQQVDSNLTEEMDEVKAYINAHQELPRQVDFDEDQTLFIKTNSRQLQKRFYDTTYFDARDNSNEHGRAIEGLIEHRGQYYKSIIIISSESSENLAKILSVITLVLLSVLLAGLFIINRYILRGLWKPFYGLLNQLKAFKVADNRLFETSDSKVDEFNELNTAANILASHLITDFQYLKNYIENASHEMMTPLAVITSKLDILIQDENLNPSLFPQINDIYSAASKLARLNQSLLLLAKIENNLIEDKEDLDLNLLISEKIRQFYELFLSRQIKISVNMSHKKIVASKYLIDILLNNLFSNSIKHNIKNGTINVILSGEILQIQNTGYAEVLNANSIFERFQKEKKSEGSGLGLAIVKNICGLYNWTVSYHYSENIHSFNIRF